MRTLPVKRSSNSDTRQSQFLTYGQMISAVEVRKLAQGSGDEYFFDFSTISAQCYQTLLVTLQHFGVRNITAIGFNCDRMAEEMRRGSKLSTTVLDSIAKHRTHYIRNIVELLSHLLRKSTALETVVLSNVEMKMDQFTKLCSAFSKCGQLKKVVLNRVFVGDDGLRVLLNALNPNTITSLTVKECGLSHASMQVIKSFLQGRTSSTGISQFVVSPKEFQSSDLDIIDGLLNKSQQSAPRVMKRSLEELRRENAELKAELVRLRESVCAVKYNDRVFIIGKDADEFVKFLGEVGDRITQLEQQKASMESFF